MAAIGHQQSDQQSDQQGDFQGDTAGVLHTAGVLRTAEVLPTAGYCGGRCLLLGSASLEAKLGSKHPGPVHSMHFQVTTIAPGDEPVGL